MIVENNYKTGKSTAAFLLINLKT